MIIIIRTLFIAALRPFELSYCISKLKALLNNDEHDNYDDDMMITTSNDHLLIIILRSFELSMLNITLINQSKLL